MRRPLIAISSRPRHPGDVRGWPTTPAAAMQYTYLESIWRAGCDEAMVAPRMRSVEEASSFLERVDGLVLVGGGDVDPARYGQDRHPRVYDVEAASDQLEISLALAAVEMELPILAICRGMQVLNVALGGSLHQHITGQTGITEHGDPSEGHHRHPVRVLPGSRLEQIVGAADIAECWSFHHQSIDRLGSGLKVSARSDDGTIEAVEFHTDDFGWMIGVQWHPERTSHEDSVQQGLFDALARAAGYESED